MELPFRNSELVLGNSRESAVKRFLLVESRLLASPEIHAEYVKAMRQAIAVNFVKLAPEEELDLPPQCLLLPPTP